MNWLQALNILILPCPICGEQHTAVDAIDRGCLDKLRDIPELLPLRPAGSVVNASSSRPPENGGEGTAEMGIRAVVSEAKPELDRTCMRCGFPAFSDEESCPECGGKEFRPLNP